MTNLFDNVGVTAPAISVNQEVQPSDLTEEEAIKLLIAHSHIYEQLHSLVIKLHDFVLAHGSSMTPPVTT
jgi:hypothetical protein